VVTSSENGSPPSLVAIGNFDGVHRGHQYLLDVVVRQAARLGLQPKVMTFDPHPSAVLARKVQPALTRTPLKVSYMQRVSPALEVVVQRFDTTLAEMSPEQFVSEVLLAKHHAQRVIVGENFRFGKGRAGDLDALVRLGSELGFSAAALPLLADELGAISSSRIRTLVAAGDVAAASELLGHPHVLSGEVVPGHRLGRTLGFPTANLGGVIELLPDNGVYACWVSIPERSAEPLPAVCNIGTRPTVGGSELRVEVHVIDHDEQLYGSTLHVALIERLRGEQRFEDTDALREQIRRDVSQAREALRGDLPDH
jgi:riboflavin kinase/FMN adenylyltransferase